MRSFSKFIALGLAIIAFSFVPASAQKFTASDSGTSTRSIEDQVRKKILKLPYYEVFDSISFQVSGDTVTLSGKVRNATNKKSAERTVRDVVGVNRVVNNIEILPLGSFDESIRVRLYDALSRTGGLSRYLWTTNPAVRLIVDGGHVSLEGNVMNRGDYNQMNIIANSVSGVFSVTNNLVIDKERIR